MASVDVVLWLLTAQLVLVLLGLAMLAVALGRLLSRLDALTKSVAGTDWADRQIVGIFERAIGSMELSATAAAATSVAVQAIARELRPMVHTQSASDLREPLVATVDLNLVDVDDDPVGS
jgi:hypothetical protein